MTSDLVDVVYHNGRGLAAPGCRGWSHVWAQVHGLHALVNLLRFLHHLRVQSIASQLGRRKKGSLSSSGVWLYSWPRPVISAVCRYLPEGVYQVWDLVQVSCGEVQLLKVSQCHHGLIQVLREMHKRVS